MECSFVMVGVSTLPHAEFSPNDHREEAPHFMILLPPHHFMKTSFRKLLYDEFADLFFVAIQIELADKIFRISHIHCRTIHFVPDI